MKDETYQARYKTGKTAIAVSLVSVALCVLFLIGCIIAGSDFVIPVTIAFFFCSGAAYMLVNSYREIRLYQNRMEVVGVIDGIISEIFYKDINHIGFANGHTDYSLRGMRGRNSTAVSELVILLKNGDRHMFGDDDYDHLPDAAAFIQDRMARL